MARMAIFDFIEGFYNSWRRHSSIGNLCPAEFERRCWPRVVGDLLCGSNHLRLVGAEAVSALVRLPPLGGSAAVIECG
jgi:hypothetical protein